MTACDKRSLLFTAGDEDAGIRLDLFLSSKINTLTRSAIDNLIKNGNCAINGIVASKNRKCKPGDKITLTVPPPEPLKVEPEDIPLDIIYEDGDLLVVNKPKGMVVHPAPGNYTGTLVNALLYHCRDSLSGINGVIRPGIVHRIDKDTSGLLIVAKNDKSHLSLASQIQNHSFDRAYECVVYGNIKEDKFTISQPIGRSPKDRKKMAVTLKNSKPAVTHVKVIRRFGGFTHCRCVLETGRTHQIRVHMSYINHPLAGDSVYGPKKVIKSLNGQCLHAKHIGFRHPSSEKWLEFESPLPEYFTDFLNKLENGYKTE